MALNICHGGARRALTGQGAALVRCVSAGVRGPQRQPCYTRALTCYTCSLQTLPWYCRPLQLASRNSGYMYWSP